MMFLCVAFLVAGLVRPRELRIENRAVDDEARRGADCNVFCSSYSSSLASESCSLAKPCSARLVRDPLLTLRGVLGVSCSEVYGTALATFVSGRGRGIK